MTNSVKVLAAKEGALHMDSAVLLYRSDKGRIYASTHPVQIDADAPARKTIGAGTAMTKGQLRAFARAVDAATAFAGFIPDNMLYSSPDMIAWWAPAMIRQTWFVGEQNGIGEVDGQAAHPALVFVALAKRWFVFALKESARPTEATALFHSPHFNVSADGLICTGNVKLPPAISADAIAAYEEAFFRSRFSHTSNQAAVTYKGGMRQLWRDQLANPDPERMNKALKPAKQTLGAAIKSIATRFRNDN